MIPYVLNLISSLAAAETGTDIFANDALAQMKQESYVLIFANREVVEIDFQFLSGDVQVMKKGPVNINATAGVVPSRDDFIGATIVPEGQRFQAVGSNTNAGAKEGRVRALVIPTALAQVNPAILQLFTP